MLTDTCCFASTLEGPVTVFHILIISVSNLHIFTLLDIRQRQFGKPRKIHFFNSCPIRSNCNWCITTLNWWLVLVVAHTLTLWPLALLSLVPSDMCTRFKTNNTKVYFYLGRLNCEVSAALLQCAMNDTPPSWMQYWLTLSPKCSWLLCTNSYNTSPWHSGVHTHTVINRW